MKHIIRRTLAMVISLLLAAQGTISLPVLAFAENPGDEIFIDGVEIESAIPIDDLDLPFDQLGDLDCDMLSGDLDCNLTLGDLSFEEPKANAGTLANGGEADPSEPVPFQQSAAVGAVAFTLSAVAGAFPGDSVLRVSEVTDENTANAVKRATEAALQGEATEHHLYRIEVLDAAENPCLPDPDMELPLVTVEGLDLKDAVRVMVYDQIKDQSLELELTNGIQFRFVDSAIYDMLEVADAKDKQIVETPKQPVDDTPSGDMQEPIDVSGQPEDDTPSGDTREPVDVPGEPEDDTPSGDAQEPVDVPGQPEDDTHSGDTQPVDDEQPADDRQMAEEEQPEQPSDLTEDEGDKQPEQPADAQTGGEPDGAAKDGEEADVEKGQGESDKAEGQSDVPEGEAGRPEDETDNTEVGSDASEEDADKPEEEADTTDGASDESGDDADNPEGDADAAESASDTPEDDVDKPEDGSDTTDGASDISGDDAGKTETETEQTEVESGDSEDNAEKTEAGEEKDDSEEAGDGVDSAGDETDGPLNESEAEQDEAPEGSAAETHEATVDLSKIERYPLSLRTILEGIANEAAGSETAGIEANGEGESPANEVGNEAAEAVPEEVGEAQPEGTGILPAAEWRIEYDNTLLAVEFTGEDYLITPLTGFEATEVTVGNGERFVLTLLNYAGEVQATEEEAQPEPREYAAEIDLSEVEDYPLSLRALMDMAAPVASGEALEGETTAAPLSDPATEGEGEQTAESEGESEAPAEAEDITEQTDLATLDWTVEYDDALLAVEPAEDDYAVTPVVAFERATITVYNGSVYRLTLCGYAPGISYPEQSFEARTETMLVSVTAPEGAFPENTTMTVADVVDENTLDSITAAATGEAGENEVVEVQAIHAVDIAFFNTAGEEIEPLLPISVNMAVVKAEPDAAQAPVVVHVDDAGEATVVEEQDAAAEEAAATFTADSFSVYALVMTTLEKTITASDGNTYAVSVTYGHDAQVPAEAQLAVSEIPSDSEAYSDYHSQTQATLGWDDGVMGFARFFDISIVDESGDEVTVQAPVSVKVELADRNSAGMSVVHFGEAPEVMDAQDDGEAVSFETAGFSVYAIVSSILAEDLDKKTFSILNYIEKLRAIGLQGKAKDSSRLQGTRVYVRPDVVGSYGGDALFLADDQILYRWTFAACPDSNNYYLKTEVDGKPKYLTMTDSAVTLTDDADAEGWSELTVTKGTGDYAGKYRIANKDGYCLILTGSLKDGFNFGVGKVNDKRSWMNLLEKVKLDDEDIMLYSARKVDISNTAEVPDNSCLVLYTRVWNEENLEYDYYLVDNDGTLVYCYEGGDEIQWFGSKINTAVWHFTEGHFENSFDPNGYYQLCSEQKLNNNQYVYIAPSLKDNEAFSFEALSFHLPGRGNGSAYSKILRWDDSAKAFIGVKTQNGRAVSCPMDEAEDFYFAWVYSKPTSEALTTVSTLNNSDYGITMRMQDYVYQGHYVGKVYRQEDQADVLGLDTDGEGIVSSTLGANGYPTAMLTEKKESLYELYKNATPVNHLFIKSTYEESGYFEFDSTQNYAYLGDGANFTVYEQLGTIDKSGGQSWDHGQFLPYNSLVGKHFTVHHVNTTNTLNEELSDLDPRKYEQMYGIPGGTIPNNTMPSDTDANYFFGMEMEASFTQTEDGLDAWGHDIIFEFSGDDDFWLYVDGELVLDLGGVHSAISGKINFRTGEVYNRKNAKSTLYEIFEDHYRKNHPGASEEEVTSYLEKTFKPGPKPGSWVFQDYSQHTLKLFYMERGASASNLHMRFNLAAARPNQIVLHKEVSGLDSDAYNYAKFPYQVWYTTKDDPAGHYRLLENVDAKGGCTVTDLDRNDPVEYKESFTPEGSAKQYDHVFFLKSGDYAAIRLPANTLDYYIVECGVDTEIYDVVKVNKKPVSGEEADGSRKDFATSKASPVDRPRVDYNNHVDKDAVRTLTFTKKLFGPDGETAIHDDPTTFAFRLSLGGEDQALNEIPLCNMKPYYIKDGDGNYCYWNVEKKTHISLGVKSFDDLTDAQKEAAIHYSSIWGAIADIPIDYTVEVRDLVPGVKFKVEEKDSEIPEGYIRMGYVRDNGDAGLPDGEAANMGAIRGKNSVHVIVKNRRGWGMTVKKVWSDADYMVSHDAVYFAIYVKDALLDGTVRRMISTKGSSDTIYYYFEELLDNAVFSDYIVREVALNGENKSIAVDDDGVVTGYSATDITPIEQGGTLELGGTPVGGDHQTNYRYTVTYEIGEPEGGYDNYRTDTVTNDRPGISIYKQDVFNKNVAGAKFTLKDKDGKDVGEESYTSDKDGLITRAYLNKGEYILEEIDAPRGYQLLSAPVTISIGEDNSIDISNLDADFYTVDENRVAIIIRNQSVSFVVKKVDQATGDPIQGAKFALYAQKIGSDGKPRKDYTPIEGYDNMTTDEYGILPGIDQNFPEGTYYLTETEPAGGYIKLEEDLIFSIDADGVPSIVSAGCGQWLTRSEDPDTHEISYVLAIPNQPDLKKIQIRKVCSVTQNVLAGAKFALYNAADFGDEDDPSTPGDVKPVAEGETGEQGLLEIEDPLPYGEYLLVETKAPAGYNMPGVCVKITVNREGVSATRGSETVSVTEEGDIWTIEVPNTPGARLPNTGGTGTLGLYALGAMMALFAALMLLRRKKAF